LAGNALDDDTQKPEEGSDARAGRTLDTVAALEATSVALVGGAAVAAEGVGGRKGGESKSGEGEFELHVVEKSTRTNAAACSSGEIWDKLPRFLYVDNSLEY
jgi:hypothetical protein